jgi:hypothetical protein
MNFEAGGNLEDWPPNVPGKQTQVAVFGTEHTTRGKCCEILWTGVFPDLQKAMYWGAKKEVEAIKKHKFMMASRVIWQHDLTPEQAVATIYKRMEAQSDLMVQAMKQGIDPEKALREGPAGPMKPIDYSKPREYYVEIDTPEGTSSGIVPNPETYVGKPSRRVW